ncbi:MAG TPA: hypothetical protein VGS07_15490 [Thermoanaerobaculia bacterium]|jgi:type I restriction enzyme S subunit|nr:hypothetical protein [Thermoanaerobaculia bacterium]
MIADLKQYPEDKASGLSWLGQVPTGWRVVRSGSLFAQRNQTEYENLPVLEVSLKTSVRVRDFGTSTRKQVMSNLGKYKRAAKGDLAYNMMRMWQGAVGVAPVDGLVSPAYVLDVCEAATRLPEETAPDTADAEDVGVEDESFNEDTSA